MIKINLLDPVAEPQPRPAPRHGRPATSPRPATLPTSTVRRRVATGILGVTAYIALSGMLWYFIPTWRGLIWDISLILVISVVAIAVLVVTLVITDSVAAVLAVLLLFLLAVGGLTWWERSAPTRAVAEAEEARATQTQVGRPAPRAEPARPPCKPDKTSAEYREEKTVTISPNTPLVLSLDIKPRQGARWEWTAGKIVKISRVVGAQEIITLMPSTETRITYAIYPCLP